MKYKISTFIINVSKLIGKLTLFNAVLRSNFYFVYDVHFKQISFVQQKSFNNKLMQSLCCILIFLFCFPVFALRPKNDLIKLEKESCAEKINSLSNEKDFDVSNKKIIDEILNKFDKIKFDKADLRTNILCGIKSKKLKTYLDHYVIFIFYKKMKYDNRSGYEDNGTYIDIGIVKKTTTATASKVLDWIATSPNSFLIKNGNNYKFDFAPYKIKPNQYAFGIRSIEYFMYSGGRGENEYLHLFKWNDGKVDNIFESLLSSYSETRGEVFEDGDEGPLYEHVENGSTETATISVLKSVTLGYFDLLKNHDKKKCVYKWNGESYKTEKEIIKDVNSFD